jgi:hypothetical protein
VTHRIDELTIEGREGRFVQPISVGDASRFLALVIAPVKLVPVPLRQAQSSHPAEHAGTAPQH